MKDNKKTFIIAEIGLNHNGSLESAERMIKAAAKCGVDAVKFQNYKTEDFIIDRNKHTRISTRVERKLRQCGNYASGARCVANGYRFLKNYVTN